MENVRFHSYEQVRERAEAAFREHQERLTSPERVAEYDALKARWEGGPMDAYREEKAAFFAKLLGSR